MYKVIGTIRSRAFRVLWALQELGTPYELIEAAPASAEAKAYNPSGKIPALLDGDDVLTDSMAIVTYLADKHGGLTAPAGTVARAKQDALTFWLVDEFDALLWTFSKHTRIYPEAARMQNVEPALHVEYARNLERLAQHLGDQDYLMGADLRVPDILACHCLGWGMMAGFPAMPEPLKAYSKRCRTRAAYKAVTA